MTVSRQPADGSHALSRDEIKQAWNNIFTKLIDKSQTTIWSWSIKGGEVKCAACVLQHPAGAESGKRGVGRRGDAAVISSLHRPSSQGTSEPLPSTDYCKQLDIFKWPRPCTPQGSLGKHNSKAVIFCFRISFDKASQTLHDLVLVAAAISV